MVSRVVINKIEGDSTTEVRNETLKAAAGSIVAAAAIGGGARAGEAINNHVSGFGDVAAEAGLAALAIPVAIGGITAAVNHGSAAKVKASTAAGKVAAAAIEGNTGFAAREDVRKAQAATAVKEV